MTPWTAPALSALLEALDREAPVQAQVLRFAAASGTGRVSREQVYELGGFPEERMLTGFTRPPLRLTQALQADGVVPNGVAPILVARYPDGVKASYFSVPSVPSLLKEMAMSDNYPEGDGASSSASVDSAKGGRPGQ